MYLITFSDDDFVVSQNIKLIWRYLCFAFLNHLRTKCQQNGFIRKIAFYCISSFLVTCHDRGVFLKFTWWKIVNKNNVKLKNKIHRKILLDEISKKQKSIKVMKKDFKTSKENLVALPTFKGVILMISISRFVIKEEKVVLKHHQKKLTYL